MDTEIKINDKLSLKFPKPEDYQDIYNLVDNDRVHLSKWLAWVDKTVSIADTEANILDRIKNFENKDAASFYIKYENKWIGSTGFISLDKKNKQGEIGYWISSAFEGKGLMTDSVKACIEYGFKDLGLHRIIIKCNGNNIKSAAIPKRLGFVLEGTLRQDRILNGNYCDTLIFGLLEDEWNK